MSSVIDRTIISESVESIREVVGQARGRGARIGVVPTMGALHEGHLSLIRAAREECDFVVVTIFVNPTQFGPHEDLDRYPRPFEADLAACRELGVDAIFHPSAETVYPDSFTTFVDVEKLDNLWEGAYRPGHFRGVATVVLKLLLMVQPDVAYFGQKDYQQQLIVRRMCVDLNVPVQIRVCPIVRDHDGLALSSRNVYLSPAERELALTLSKSLQFAARQLQSDIVAISDVKQGMQQLYDEHAGIQVDYIAIADPDTLAELSSLQERMVVLVAARVGKTRLIDNCLVSRDSTTNRIS